MGLVLCTWSFTALPSTIFLLIWFEATGQTITYLVNVCLGTSLESQTILTTQPWDHIDCPTWGYQTLELYLSANMLWFLWFMVLREETWLTAYKTHYILGQWWIEWLNRQWKYVKMSLTLYRRINGIWQRMVRRAFIVKCKLFVSFAIACSHFMWF